MPGLAAEKAFCRGYQISTVFLARGGRSAIPWLNPREGIVRYLRQKIEG